MLRTCVFLFLTPFILIPPGMCVCHILEEFEQHSHSEEHESDDHPPGCPARKHLDGQCHVEIDQSFLQTAPLFTPLENPCQPPGFFPLETCAGESQSGSFPSQNLPLYGTLRAYLI